MFAIAQHLEPRRDEVVVHLNHDILNYGGRFQHYTDRTSMRWQVVVRFMFGEVDSSGLACRAQLQASLQV